MRLLIYYRFALKEGTEEEPVFLIHSDWIPMRSSPHDALGQPLYSQTLNPSHSVSGPLCVLRPDTAGILLIFNNCVAMKILEKIPRVFY